MLVILNFVTDRFCMFEHVSLESIKNLVWSPPLFSLLVGTAIYLTFQLKGLQFRYLIHSLKLALGPEKNSEKNARGDITNFQALMTSLAAAIGTGNIAGVATAIVTGGLGALFWMWFIAILAMVIKYSEALLAVKYRVRNARGEMSGGPMYYLALGLNWKKTAVLFSLFGILATFGTGNMVQVNSVADSVNALFDIPMWITGLCLSILSSFVLLGGVKSIGKVAEYLVPLMAGLYVGSGLIIIFLNFEKVPQVLADIMYYAFHEGQNVQSFLGASLGTCIQVGISRGVFSNEAGLGTSSIASAAAKTHSAPTQGMISMTSAFLSTIIVCSITGLVIGVTDTLGALDQHGRLLNGAPLAMKAFGSSLRGGEYIVSIGLILFACSTILGWAYYGEKCIEFVWGTKRVIWYRIIYILCMTPAAIIDLHSVWTIADIMNGLMIIPNVLGVIALRKVISHETRRYCKNLSL